MTTGVSQSTLIRWLFSLQKLKCLRSEILISFRLILVGQNDLDTLLSVHEVDRTAKRLHEKQRLNRLGNFNAPVDFRACREPPSCSV